MKILYPFMYLMQFILSFWNAIYLYRIMGQFVDYRNGSLFKAAIILGCCAMSNMPIDLLDPVNSLGIFCLFMGLMLVCSNSRLINKVSVILLLFPIILGMNFITGRLVWKIIDLTGSGLEHVIWLRNIFSLIKIGIWYLISRNLAGRLKSIKKYVDTKTWLLADTICLLALLSMLVAIIKPPSTNILQEYREITTGYDLFGTYLIVMAGIFTNLGVILLFDPLIENVKMKMDHQASRIREEYYHSLEKQQDQIRKIRHEMNHHFQMLYTCLEQQNPKEAKQYLETLLEQTQSTCGRKFCQNQVLNAILNDRYGKLLENQVDTHFNISIDTHLGIDVMDLGILFANALDNALEASLKITETNRRKVVLQTRCENGMFSFRLNNRKNNEIYASKGRILTDKPDKRNHGYGLETMQDLVDKYHGTLEISYTDDEFTLFFYIRTL
ncbi:GHKL domain-containing protein [Lachnospiraceae bacterium ASD3451]|uniref:sensor histidine kinase n=1 Tax=Diplocloster agilis TaxID=2850323 RepID=UPI001DF80AFF|nr:ATP-binding protein [Diplocloster agilis]MBU9743246.1 GHKL domain-containing protein [Diplocloster agilis]